MYVIVAYDIEDNRRRTKIARFLEGFGERVQYSVFECDLEERHLRRMVTGLQAMMQPGDAIRIYRLDRRSEAEIIVLGGRPKVKCVRVTVV